MNNNNKKQPKKPTHTISFPSPPQQDTLPVFETAHSLLQAPFINYCLSALQPIHTQSIQCPGDINSSHQQHHKLITVSSIFFSGFL